MALSADRTLTTFQWDPTTGIIRTFPVAATTVIYKGGFVSLNSAGYLVMHAAPTVGTSIVGGHRFVGIALDHIASQTSNGDASCDVLVEGYFQHALGSAAITDQGKPVFASADDTLTLSALGNAYVGTIQRLVSSGVVIVHLNGYVAKNGKTLVTFASPIITTTALNKVLVIPQSENPNGLIIENAYAMITTVMAGAGEDQGIITLQDTDGTTLGVTFTPTDAGADAANDVVQGVGDVADAATGAALVVVAAGKGVQATVTQACAGAGLAGAMKIFGTARAIA